MTGADMRQAQMANAVLDKTVLQGADLRGASCWCCLRNSGFSADSDENGRCACESSFDEGETSVDELCSDDAAPDARWVCRTRLDNTNYAGANVLGVNFTGADLKGALWA